MPRSKGATLCGTGNDLGELINGLRRMHLRAVVANVASPVPHR